MNIGFYSSSTPITVLSPERFKRAERFLDGKGVNLTPGSLTGQIDGYRSGSIAERANEINELIHNNDVDVIMSTIGGTNTNSVLPYLDYEYLKLYPKTFVGYSDATALLLAIQTQAPNCQVLYGPALVASLGEWSPIVEKTWDYFIQVMQLKQNEKIQLVAPKTWTDEQLNWETFERDKKELPNQWHSINQDVLKGRIMGGNLNTMYGMIDSKYFPHITNNDLLFIEDAEKDAATVEKNFAMLKDAGILDLAKGIILGKHALFDDEGTGIKPIDILREVLNDDNKPIIYDYDSCHTAPMMTTPLGKRCIIDANSMKIEFTD